MLRYVVKRLLQSAVTLLIVITLVFLVLRLMPVEGYFRPGEYDKLSESQIQQRLENLGLNDPLPLQLLNFYKNLLHGDFGVSMSFRENVAVTEIIGPKVPYSVCFGLAAIAIAFLLGVPLGILMTTKKGKLGDQLGTGYVIFMNAVPAAVYYIFIQVFVTSWLRLPMIFDVTRPRSWFLPAICMSLGGIASYAMWTRRYMVDQLNQDYIKLAIAKGMKRGEVMRKHVVRNALVPLVQYLPSSILFTISGSIYAEQLYSIPGMGGLLISAINAQDNNLVQALVLIYSSIGILGLFLGDLMMGLLDPRIKLAKSGGAR